MVQNVLRTLYREVRGLHEAAYVLAVFTFGSQILALIRDRLLAHQFGAGLELDLYYAAFRIPDLLYVLFASMLSVYVLIPFVAGRIKSTDASRARHLLSQIFTVFLIAYTLLAGLIALFAPSIVGLVFPGFQTNEAELVLLMRILLLQPLFLGVSSLLGVITQFGQRFVLYAVSPLLYNVGIIGGLLFLYPDYGLAGLAAGVVIGAVAHLLIQVPYVVGSELAPRTTFKINFREVGDVLRVSIPRTLTLSLHQIVLLGLVGFASVMTVGSVAVFQFAFNLQSVPLAIIGVSYSVAAFPLLARLYAEGKIGEFRIHITTALRHIIFWSLPVIALMIVVRAQFVRVIFGTGEFDWDDTRLTAAVLALFVCSLTAQAIHLLVVRALYAVGNTRLPFYVTLASSALALIFSFIFYALITVHADTRLFIESMMRLSGVPGTEVLALPLGYSCALIVHTLTLLFLSRQQLSLALRPIFSQFLKSVVASLAAGIVAYVTLNLFVIKFETETLIGIAAQGFLACLCGLGAAVLTHLFQRSQELAEVSRALRRRMFKTSVVTPQDEDHLSV